jgi:translation elongation factor P/translation initiation factor 5A
MLWNINFLGGQKMKEYTDGVLTVKVGKKYAHVINKAGSEMGVMDKQHFERYAKDAGFTPVEDDPPESLLGLGF